MAARQDLRLGAMAALAAASVVLGGCGGLTDQGRRAGPGAAADPLPPPLVTEPASTGSTLGSGPVKVALVLPLGAAGAAAGAALSLRNAAELALSELPGAPITILVKDDRGTADGAVGAVNAALADGAELVIGPLFAPAVAAAGTVARGAGRPLVAFSTDVGVASRGTYLLSFLPQTEIDRIVDYAADQGRRSVAALLPDTVYGSVVEAAFREAAARRNLRVAAIERFPAGQPGPAVGRLAALVAGPAPQADALLVPASGEELAAIDTALAGIRFDPGKVKPLGTGLWSDRRASASGSFRGGWFAAPDTTGFAAFAARYRARYGSEPSRIATLAFDAVSLAAAMARQPPAARFTDAALQSPSGFTGADGAFRFRADGTNERALAVNEIRPDGPVAISPAPKGFGRAGL